MKEEIFTNISYENFDCSRQKSKQTLEEKIGHSMVPKTNNGIIFKKNDNTLLSKKSVNVVTTVYNFSENHDKYQNMDIETVKKINLEFKKELNTFNDKMNNSVIDEQEEENQSSMSSPIVSSRVIE